MANNLFKGTQQVKQFYDEKGWQRRDGVLVDTQMFGWKDGPLRREIEKQRKERILRLTGEPDDVVELGCGGTPAMFLAERCATYTAVDFSSTGLDEAAKALTAAKISFRTFEADITALPFKDNTFGLAYSSHVLYHIDSKEGQALAFQEAIRILRPGGRAIFVLANPFPILFPYRAFRRLLAMTPVINAVLNRLRKTPPLPYLPMSLGWMKKQLRQWGNVRITGYAIPSVDFDHRVSETSAIGRRAWRVIQYLEEHCPVISARLGCYVLIVVDKQRSP